MKIAVPGWSNLPAVLAGLIVIILPVIAAWVMADHESRQDMQLQARQLASEVLERSQQITVQIDRSEHVLTAPGIVPCSPQHLHLMAGLTIENPLLVAFGQVVNDRLMCSSFGLHGKGIPLGPPDYLSKRQRYIRSQAQIPQLSREKVLLSTAQNSGFTVVIHPSVALDVRSNEPDLSLGLYNPRSLTTLVQRATFRPSWHARLGARNELSFFDGDFVVALKRSDQYDFIAYAALPVSRFDRGRLALALVLVPLGMVAGVLLALIVMRTLQRRASLTTQLRNALKRNEFYLVYQPVVDLQTGHWVGAEALLRWQRANGLSTPPDVFIPVAEHAGLITQITQRVCELCIHDLRHLLRAHPNFHISLNFSAEDFAKPQTLRSLCALLEHSGLNAQQFQIEATERVLLEQETTHQQVAAMRAMGLRIAIDDFGTGYSSLSYLTSLRVDTLKIDKTFVETIGTDAATSQVVAHIIAMVKSLELAMIAEGVETEEQVRYLRERGVQYAQGWYYARAMSAPALIQGFKAQVMHNSPKP